MRCVSGLLLMMGILTIHSACRPGGTDASSQDSSERDKLEREYAFYQSLDPQQRQQLRELDDMLTDPANENRAKQERVLASFNYWLSQLSDADRQSVLSEKNWEERLKAIKRIREREWVETLPKTYREKFAKATPVERIRLIEFWREEQKERHADWAFVRKNWEDVYNDKIPNPFQSDKFRKEMEVFVAHLEAQIHPQEQRALNRYVKQQPEERDWLRFIRLVVELADRHPLLPGPDNGPRPRTFDELPVQVKSLLERGNPKVFVKKENYPKRLQNTEGRWPDYAIAVVEHARSHRVILPEQVFGPTTKAALPAEVHAVVEKMENMLKRMEKTEKGEKAEQAAGDLKRLKDAENKWPDYPRTVMELAKQYRLDVPGWMLPGNPDLWARFRTKKEAKKG